MNSSSEVSGMDELTQEQADALITVEKVFVDSRPLIVNRPYKERRELKSKENSADVFYLHITQTAIEFGKFTSNTRFFTFPLIRLCIDKDAVHENPDTDEKITGSHIHIFKEGFADTIAKPISDYGFSSENIIECIPKFLEICNIEKIKIVDQTLLADNDGK